MSQPFLERSVRFLPGVGERRAQLFARLDVQTVGDLLSLYPRCYEDWSSPFSIADALFYSPCCVKVTVLNEPKKHVIRKNMTLFRFTVTDGNSGMMVTLFNNPYAAAKIRQGKTYLLYGTVTGDGFHYEMSAPQIGTVENGKIRPVYPQTEGLSSRVIEMAMERALNDIDAEDCLPEEFRQKHTLCHKRYALQNIHFPQTREALNEARRRLVFEELLLLQLGLFRLKGRSRTQTAVTMPISHTEEYTALLPFSLTGAQRRALDDCVRDMAGQVPMNRLIQGDVGSGKTAVAAGVAYTAAKNGYQTALMAPTEILATQHAQTLQKLLGDHLRVGLLIGSMTAAEKRRCREQAANGEWNILVGTHALLSENLTLPRLGLVITDEQHRFGVDQRAKLAAKGARPHMLVMSATPIPRTLALMIYGDLDVSVLNELPPGRQPVSTYAVGTDKRERVYRFIKKHVAEGKQVYIVCPLVEEGETELVAARQYAQQLAEGPFAGISLGLLHGKMKPAEKAQTMSGFAAGEISILVSTTVVEVGMDVPNAVLMVIENAERFGLAQLHQLRGRVGRGTAASSCILISDAQNKEAVRRMKVMCETTDGFRIAEEDLKLRGPGDFFGHRQHGLPELRLADLSADMEVLQQAQTAAKEIYATDPNLCRTEHTALKSEVDRMFGRLTEQAMN